MAESIIFTYKLMHIEKSSCQVWDSLAANIIGMIICTLVDVDSM